VSKCDERDILEIFLLRQPEALFLRQILGLEKTEHTQLLLDFQKFRILAFVIFLPSNTLF
jgi:hypothetical protein